MKKLTKHFSCYLLLFVITFSACNKENIDSSNLLNNCNKELTPVVMMHGFLASGDTYANQKMRFEANGYCTEYIFVYDWNSLDQNEDRVSTLDLFINNVLEATGSSKINLVGHSAGGSLGYNYLSDENRAKKVNKYVHIGSFPNEQPAGPNGDIPTLNIWSTEDETVQGGNITGAENVMLSGADHYQVATNAETFEAMYKFFNDNTAPSTTDFSTTENTAKISGKVLTLGENKAIANADIFIFELDNQGNKISNSAKHTFKSNINGFWGPINLDKNKKHLFEVKTNISGDRDLFYYREAFVANNSLVYLRTFPPASTLAGILLSSIPANDNQAALIIFTANQAVVSGRDNLLVNGETISTPEFASADQTSIAFFLFDGNENQITDFSSVGLFGTAPFLAGIDFYFQTTSPQQIECNFNNRKLFVKNRKSSAEGISIAVFD